MQKDVLINSNKTYLFARSLVNSELGAVGRGQKVKELGQMLHDLFIEAQCDDLTIPQIRSKVTEILTRTARSEKSLGKRRLLAQNLCEQINTPSDLRFLGLTCRVIMPLLNTMVEKAPKSADVKVASIIKELELQGVPSQGAQSLALNTIEQKEISACLEEERKSVILYTDRLMKALDEEVWMTSNDRLVIVTGFIQEGERRIGQKRKIRSGNSTKNAIATIMVLNGVKQFPKPEEAAKLLDTEFWVRNDTGMIGVLASHNFRNTVLGFLKSPTKERCQYIHILANKRDMKAKMISSVIGLGHTVVIPDQYHAELSKSIDSNKLIKMRKFISDILPALEKVKVPVVRTEKLVDEVEGSNEDESAVLEPLAGFESQLMGIATTNKLNKQGERLKACVYDASHLSMEEIEKLLRMTGTDSIFVRKPEPEEDSLESMNSNAIVFPNYETVGVAYSKERRGMAIYDVSSMIEAIGGDDATSFFETAIEPSSLSDFGPYFLEQGE